MKTQVSKQFYSYLISSVPAGYGGTLRREWNEGLSTEVGEVRETNKQCWSVQADVSTPGLKGRGWPLCQWSPREGQSQGEGRACQRGSHGETGRLRSQSRVEQSRKQSHLPLLPTSGLWVVPLGSQTQLTGNGAQWSALQRSSSWVT